MRWDRLFEDLEAAWSVGLQEESRAEVADRTRRERASVSLVGRLSAATGPIELVLLTGRRCAGPLADVGQDFLVLADGAQRVIVPLAAVLQVTGVGRFTAGPRATTAVRRFSLGSALRAVARDRSVVRVEDRAGRYLTGTIDAVGADYLELVEHPLDVPRRESAVQATRLLPYGGIVSITSA